MMKRVFLDTNIMLDLAMHREHFDAALAIMKGAYEDPSPGSVPCGG